VFACRSPGNHLLEENHDGVVLAVSKNNQMDSEYNGQFLGEDKFLWAINHFAISNLNGKISPITPIFNKPLFLTQVQALFPHYVVLETPTNDRMRYQKGVLFFFYHAVIFYGSILFPYSNKYGSNLLVVGKIHKGNGKRECYSSIEKTYPYYAFEYLLDPFAYFC